MIGQIINAVLGIFLMAAPGLFDLGPAASDNFQIIGPVVTTFAVISWWEATRAVRLWNVPLGAWLVTSPVVLAYESGTAVAIAIGVGIAVTALAFVRGKIDKRYGGGWTSLWRENAAHEQEARARQPRHVESGSTRPE